ncbi:carbon storage regulator, partial [Pseudomonas syringae pv. actinidiae]|nr:carbon storage regulator [Pseudomonas syringae pv. actinidiae]
IEAPDFVTVQCKDVDSEVTDLKRGTVITHKLRRRSLVTK